MKGKYSGRHMTIYGYVLPGAVGLANWAARTENVSEKAKQRLRALDWLKKHKGNVSLAARHYGITRETVIVWRNKFKEKGIMGLNDKSHRPKNIRRPTTDWSAVSEIVGTRTLYPAWSKYKIKKMLERKGIFVSSSTVGRVLKRKGLINKKISKKRSKAAKHPRKRFPRGFKIANPGDMVQMDTKHLTLIGGRRIYQFTAIDVLTKRRVLKYYPSLSSENGADFLEHCLARFPFSARNIQTDNGPEFLKYFERLCLMKGLPHYFIETRQPKQNTYVENSHGSDDKEFYGQGNIGCSLKTMQEKLDKWEYVWNCIRPHQALNYLTPEEYLNKWQTSRLPTRDTIILQA
jgi:transposase InsO family protein